MHPQPKERRFRRSALTEGGHFLTTAEARSWLLSTAETAKLAVEPIPFSQLGEWSFDPATGDLRHRTGKFFRVHGLRVAVDSGSPTAWDQPIIDQPEIGILGIIAKELDGILHFLMQAKMEPGNPLGVQMVPTVQATRSNYTQVHQGARPEYVDYMLDRSFSRVLVDQLQFEQGSAFFRKRNRNIVVEVTGDVPVLEGYRWLTLGQIRALLQVPSLVSMDTRTVVSCMPLIERGPLALDPEALPGPSTSFAASLLASGAEGVRSLHTRDGVLEWLTDLKCRRQMDVERIGIRSLRGWSQSDREIAHDDGRFFRMMAVRVESDSREVARWSQPLVAPTEQGLIAFLVKQIHGVLHFLVQGKIEPGNPDTVALGPSVQCGLGCELVSDPSSWPPFADVVQTAPPDWVRYSCRQSEEGGRFYRLESEYRIVELPPEVDPPLPESYTWMTLGQLNEMLRFGLVNVEARSLLACLSFTSPART